MNKNELEGNWKQFKGRVQQRWGELTDDDLASIQGRRTELIGLIQARYGRARDIVEQEVDEFIESLQHHEQPMGRG